MRAIEIEGHTSIRSARIELGHINILIGASGADRQLAAYTRRSGGASHLLNRTEGARRIRLALDSSLIKYEAFLGPSDGVSPWCACASLRGAR